MKSPRRKPLASLAATTSLLGVLGCTSYGTSQEVADSGAESAPNGTFCGRAGTPSGIRWVQENDGSAGAGTTSFPLTLKSVAAHDALVVAIAFSPSTAPLSPPHDSLGSSFEVLSQEENLILVGAFDVPTSGDDTITLDASGLAAVEVYATEYSGLGRLHATAVDDVKPASGLTPGQPAVSVQAAASGELVFAFVDTSQGAATEGAGFCRRTTNANVLIEDRLTDSSGPSSVTASIAGSNVHWAALTATFKAQPL
jgi:hypothetical protein